MDMFDQAQDLEMLQRNASIEAARKPLANGPAYTGFCHYCEDPATLPRRFCDGECREGWEAEQAARKRNGYTEDGSASLD